MSDELNETFHIQLNDAIDTVCRSFGFFYDRSSGISPEKGTGTHSASGKPGTIEVSYECKITPPPERP